MEMKKEDYKKHKKAMWDRQRKHAQLKTNKSKPNIEEAPEGSLQWYVEQHDKIKINKIKKNL